MADTSEGLQARSELIEKWGDTLAELTNQMIEQAREQGINPAWFYPAKILETKDTISISWKIRPDVEAALTAMDRGVPAEEAAKLGAAVGKKSLEQLIQDDTVWIESEREEQAD